MATEQTEMRGAQNLDGHQTANGRLCDIPKTARIKNTFACYLIQLL